MKPSRREFLTTGLGGAALAATSLSVPGFLSYTARAAAGGSARRRDGSILVVVQLTGGNDGLNTVVPHRDDRYHKARPTLRIASDRALSLTDALGLHPDMTGLKRLFDDGLLEIVTNVGYPNPDRSHFRSMDIWHTARLTPEDAQDGWLGRLVDRCGCPGLADDARRSTVRPGSSDVAVPFALHLDDDVLPLALQTRRQPVPSVRSLDAFRLPADADALADAIALPRDAATDDLLFVQRTAVSSCAQARRIELVASDRVARAPYPGYGLATRLQQIAQLIGADFGPRIYYTSLGGFDTHARQAATHAALLRELSDSIAAFYDDLKARRLADRVLLLTFSEFGRRVAENSGQGTDHGAAAPVFLVGGDCKAGVTGPPPDLANLLDGDLRHNVDFRSVYARVLDEWLEIPSVEVLPDARRGA